MDMDVFSRCNKLLKEKIISELIGCDDFYVNMIDIAEYKLFFHRAILF